MNGSGARADVGSGNSWWGRYNLLEMKIHNLWALTST